MKKIWLLAIIVCMVLIFGCGTQQNSTTGKTAPFVGGTTGVTVGYSQDSPPSEVDDGGNFPFDVVVELVNKGEFTVPKDKMTVKLVGIRPEEFSKTEAQLTAHPDEDVTATKKDPEGFITEGPPIYVTFSDLNHKEQLVGNKEFPFRAEVCYYYETTATAPLCVRKNNIDPEKNGICEVSSDQTPENSGSPVQVTTFKEFGRAKNKVGFQFTVAHVGTGDIFEKDSTCNTERKYEDQVFVKVETAFNSGLKCSGLSSGDDKSGYVKLFGNSRIVSCTQDVDTTSDYETAVTVKLSYDYRDNTQTTVLVKHIPPEEK